MRYTPRYYNPNPAYHMPRLGMRGNTGQGRGNISYSESKDSLVLPPLYMTPERASARFGIPFPITSLVTPCLACKLRREIEDPADHFEIVSIRYPGYTTCSISYILVGLLS